MGRHHFEGPRNSVQLDNDCEAVAHPDRREGAASPLHVTVPLQSQMHNRRFLTPRRQKTRQSNGTKTHARLGRVHQVSRRALQKGQEDQLVVVNLSRPYETFPPWEAKRLRKRFEFVYTRAHGSWLNPQPFATLALSDLNRMSEEKRMDEFSAVFSRVVALVQLIGGQALKRWAIPRPHDPQHLYYPDAVVLAAAVSPLNDDLTFQMDQFERLVEERMRGMNPGRFVAFI